MINIVLGNMILLRPWVPRLENFLSFKRQEYNTITRRYDSIRQALYLKREHNGMTEGYIPIGMQHRLETYLKQSDIPYTLTDIRYWKNLPMPAWENVDFLGLREGQAEALQAIATNHMGIIEAATAFGKGHIILQACRMYPDLRIVITTSAASVIRTLYQRLMKDPLLAGQVGAISGQYKMGNNYRVTVVTARSLAKANAADCDLVFADECFPAGTMIGKVPIEDTKVGDFVESYDKEIDKVVWHRVTKKFIGWTDTLVDIETSKNRVSSTPAHPICTGNEKEYIPAEELSLQNNVYLKRKNQSLVGTPIRCLRKKKRTCLVYNIEVEGTHNYFANGILVHNCHNFGAVKTAEALVPFEKARIFGFSASPKGRSDNTDMVTESVFGPTIFKRTYQEAEASGSVVPLEVLIHPVEKCNKDLSIYKTAVALNKHGIWLNTVRNKQIANDVRKYVKEGQCLIMVATIEHLMRLKQLLPEAEIAYSNCSKARYQGFLDKGFTTEPYKTKKDILELQGRLERNECQLAIATHVYKEGVDFCDLLHLFKVDGQGGEIGLTQIPGRLSRQGNSKDKKKGYLHDYGDGFHPNLRKKSLKRIKSYKAKGWTIKYADKF